MLEWEVDATETLGFIVFFFGDPFAGIVSAVEISLSVLPFL
jgi:hypothetical protein